MSTSALLLTLLLAFYPSLSVASSRVKSDVLLSSRLLGASVSLDAFVLAGIIFGLGQEADERINRHWLVILVLVGFVPFMLGTLVMYNAVYFFLSP